MSAAASATDEPATGPLFSDRTDDTDKTITRYTCTISQGDKYCSGNNFQNVCVYMYFLDDLLS